MTALHRMPELPSAASSPPGPGHGGRWVLSPVLMLVVGGVVAAALGVILFWGHALGVDPGLMLRDPAQVHQFWPLSGVVSYLGILIMWGAATTCLMGAALTDRATARFLGLFGVFTAVLAVDDMFMFHEYFWPRFGVHEFVILMGLAAAGLALLVAYRDRLLHRAQLGFQLAVMLFVASLMIDVAAPFMTLTLILEDGLKLLGQAIWAAFFACTVYRAVSDRMTPGPTSTSA